MNKVEVLKSFEDLSVLFGLRVETPEVEPEIGWYVYKVVGFTAKYDGVIHKGCTDEEAQGIASSLGYRVVLVDVRNKTDEAKNKKLFINGVEMKGCSVSDFIVEKENTSDGMENYIREYKHLIGCTYFADNKDYYLSVFDHFVLRYHDLNSVADLVLYLEDGTLVSYGAYMKTYYPEYKHIWQEQL